MTKRKRRFEVAAVEGIDCPAEDLDVLLRHRPAVSRGKEGVRQRGPAVLQTAGQCVGRPNERGFGDDAELGCRISRRPSHKPLSSALRWAPAACERAAPGSAEVSRMASETTISAQECMVPGTRTRPLPNSPLWMRSSMAFSSSMFVGRRTRSGRKEMLVARPEE
jgi:hypothetical protein